MAQDEWASTSLTPPLTREVTHVWLAHLDQSTHVMEHLQHILSDEECQKAARFRFAQDQLRYSVAHAFMRQVLAS